MGPPSAAGILRESLFRGVDRVALLSDKRFAGADTLATSYALACAIRKVGDVDLVFAGRQAIDGDTAQVGPQTAEKLGRPTDNLRRVNREARGPIDRRPAGPRPWNRDGKMQLAMSPDRRFERERAQAGLGAAANRV